MGQSRRTVLTLGAALAALATAGRATTGLAAETLAFEPEALAWVRANARPLSADPAIADLRPMVEALQPARIIGIGEATHGTHEDFALKCQLIKAMVAFGGVRCVALEANLSSGLALDGYVRGGKGDITDLLRTSGFFQNWQTEEFGGLFTWLRGWNLAGKEPVRIIAIDCQATPFDADYAVEWLARVDAGAAGPLRARLAPLLTPENKASRLLEVIQAMTAAERDGYIAALEALKTAIAGRPADADQALALHAAEVARQGLLIFERDVKDGPKEEPPTSYWARRDRFMAGNLIALAGQDRAVLHAHNGHVIPTPFEDIPDSEGSQGLYLRRALGAKYQTVAFEYDRGLIHAKLMTKGGPVPGRDQPWITAARPSRPDGLGAFLARTGQERFWLDLRPTPASPGLKAWRAHRYQHDWPGYVVDESTELEDWSRQAIEGAFDLLVFFRTVTPSRFYDYVKQA